MLCALAAYTHTHKLQFEAIQRKQNQHFTSQRVESYTNSHTNKQTNIYADGEEERERDPNEMSRKMTFCLLIRLAKHALMKFVCTDYFTEYELS